MRATKAATDSTRTSKKRVTVTENTTSDIELVVQQVVNPLTIIDESGKSLTCFEQGQLPNGESFSELKVKWSNHISLLFHQTSLC